eukprot:TRINITY_DN32822_c0_g1_i1.p1 TRINITY_DN32822_c0_g1~~TRINITY_DN32822_c0_g1_i1.p1  ORF type:complete len:511 (+),score=153.98 TRINITY_DN32822_c0_g1_i1:173-1534(+)
MSDDEESKEDDDDDSEKDFVQREACQNIVIAVILLNTFVMALEADYPDYPEWPWVDSAFLLFFVGEITLKLCAVGCYDFFTNPADKAWNIFDFSIVAMGVLDQWILRAFFMVEEASSPGTNSTLMGAGGRPPSFSKALIIMRVLRILRVLRAVRLFKSFPSLYRLVQGLIGSFQSVCWVAVLFGLWLLVSSIIVTNLVGRQAEEFVSDEVSLEDVLGWFGGIVISMKTLFIYLTCDDWSTSARAVNAKLMWMELFWILYMIVGAFTLLSLLTGLMADKMNEVREESESDSKEEDAKESRKTLKLVGQAMQAHDDNHDGCIDLNEFREICHDKKFLEAAKCLEVDIVPGEEAALYKALDIRGTGNVPWEEFSENLIALSKENVEMKNVLWLEGALMKVDHAMSKYVAGGDTMTAREAWGQRVDQLSNRASRLQEKVLAMQQVLLDEMKKAGYKP